MTQPDPQGNGINLNKPADSGRDQGDLRIDPPTSTAHTADVPGWVADATRPQDRPQAQHQHQGQPDFGNRAPTGQPGAGGAPWNLASLSDIGTKKLVAGLLAIFLGAFGAHKFYLGRTTPGLIVLLVHIGGWFLTGVLSIVTLGLGAIILVPLMSLVATALGIVGLIEGIVYLTRSDQDFYQTYVVGKKDWF
ncbi:hypothetical protein DKM44_12025 [Deinococcus irradiatisoli]|uniref:TM2 domain-containing protein n=1 Tax=Deinococcus irradiatisoli TaxID=2202254 RepID=A0A2Z3JT71_9DEIO|nr:TM2 domain-containing protein [Deinococcus irradiatisoli]AWN23864.1 hypothetical protein DKM44_12025 [Deinococcus irradiatisoli]